jgi:sucrose-phosphate synthase
LTAKHHDKNKYYIVLISVHGLIRGENLELGRDADTGGQTLYVIELARALAAHPDVARVDLLTRRVIDSKLDESYSAPQEKLAENAWIVRLNCGPRRYLRKEVLWPHLPGFIDSALQHIRNVGQVPDIVHSHYADAGLVGSRLAGLLGVPLVHTGHSLGREKQARLLEKGLSQEAIENQYNMSARIEAEEIVLGTAAKVIVSTQQEIDEQYKSYDNYQPSRMTVIPPGVDLSRFHPPNGSEAGSAIAGQVDRFLDQPDKPMILALSRADERKNIASLVRAYGESVELKNTTNLVIVAGNRDDISAMDKGPRQVLTELLMLIDRYDLYGHVAYPKHHKSEDVPVLYRLAARRKGAFINPALTEPFGLTLIEAAASGLPIVATNDGGPKEIIAKCNNGYLINPLKVDDIKRKLLDVFADEKRWQELSKNGIDGAYRHFSWPGHVETYINNIKEIIEERKIRPHVRPAKSRLPTVDRLAFSAIDNSLFGDEPSMRELVSMVRENARNCGFGIVTGRSLTSTKRFLSKMKLPYPDILITSVGTEIYYCHRGGRLVEDAYWPHHIDYRWQPKGLLKIMQRVPGIKLRGKIEQTQHRISYSIDQSVTPTPREIKRLLRTHDLHAKIVVTEGKWMDLLPIRASKGLAIRYLAMKWGLALDRIMVVGDSGNDEEMLLGDTLGVVVGNHSSELDKLKGKPRIYFAEGEYSKGIIEGIEHYNFFGEITIPEEAEKISSTG